MRDRPDTAETCSYNKATYAAAATRPAGSPFNEQEVVMSEKLKVGILGATGMVGQRFVTLL